MDALRDHSKRCALVIGHPGHELRVFGWASVRHPRVSLLTDGSGLEGQARIDATADLLRAMGCERDGVFGVAGDAALYREILNGNTGFFIAIAERLAQSFAADDIACVVADAAEGFNPTHDICRYVADSAALLASRRTGRPIATYQFGLVEREVGKTEQHDATCFHVPLADAAFAAKLRAARDYGALDREVAAALALYGEDYFRTECLRPAPPLLAESTSVPFYEEIGARRAARGEFSTVLRYSEHVRPIRLALAEHAQAG